jgi:hypothetical protein
MKPHILTNLTHPMGGNTMTCIKSKRSQFAFD